MSYELAAPEERKVFRPTGLMEKVSRTVEEEPGLSKRALRTAEGGKKDYLDLAIELLLAEGFIEPRKDEQAIRHTRKGRSGKPKTPPPWPVAEPWPDCDRPRCRNRGPVAPPVRGHGHGHTETPTESPYRGPSPRCSCLRPGERLSDGRFGRCYGAYPEGWS